MFIATITIIALFAIAASVADAIAAKNERERKAKEVTA